MDLTVWALMVTQRRETCIMPGSGPVCTSQPHSTTGLDTALVAVAVLLVTTLAFTLFIERRKPTREVAEVR